MRNLQELDDLVLIDMLAEYTQKFTQLFRNFTERDPDYQSCKEMITRLTLELDRRRGQSRQKLNSNLEQDSKSAPI
jgi:hypothetical protein